MENILNNPRIVKSHSSKTFKKPSHIKNSTALAGTNNSNANSLS